MSSIMPRDNSGEQIRFFDFSSFHNKRPPAGSTYIRVHQLIKYWDEADLYKYGENPEVLIFQKVYLYYDYRFPEHFEGLKILDVCDPDWMDSEVNIHETINAMDTVTCPTENIAEFVGQFTDKPIKVIKDRFDLELVPEPKEHLGEAKTVVWFGYYHNSELLRPALNIIQELGLELIVISDEDPFFNKEVKSYKFIKYKEDTIYEDLKRADFAILPEGFRPRDRFKSNNREIRANLAGLPVAKTKEEVEHFMEARNRQQWLDDSYGKIKEEYDVKKSINEYKELIREIRGNGNLQED